METIIEEKYKYLVGNEDSERRNKDRSQIVSKEAEERYNNSLSTVVEYCIGSSAFIAGVKWADANPSLDMLVKIFFILVEKGLINDDLCVNPEQYIENTIIPLYKKYYDM